MDDDVELSVEDENDEVPHVEFDISVSPSDPTLELIVQQIEREDIIIPFYQRKYVWKIEQASRLIESFLMGLPVPQVFLYVNSEDQLEVIDGQQRLMSVKYFMEGFFGDEDAKGARKVFKLRGLSERSEYNGRTYKELSPKDQRKIRNSTLRAINIKQQNPVEGSDSVFHIFQRLNTGGTLLRPQEIRNAVYRGNIVERLTELNSLPEWQQILGLKQPDKNQKDVELVLRLFSLFEVWQEYEKPMLKYLNSKMKENRAFDSERAAIFEVRFPACVSAVAECIEKPFRPNKVINSAVLESVMIALLEMDDLIQLIGLQDKYLSLLDNVEFIARISGSTTDTLMLRKRIEIAKQYLNG